MRFLPASRQALVLILLLLGAVVVFYAAPKERRVDLRQPLSSLPAQLDTWHMQEDVPMRSWVQEVLQADQMLNRTYINALRPEQVALFMAYFRSQSTGVSPHSPKNCLPGAGWVPSRADVIRIPVPGENQSFPANRYIISKGEERLLVLYWYQSHNRVVADEYQAKLWLILDSMRYHRSDTSIVRVSLPVQGSEEQAEQAAINFAQAVFKPLRSLFPL